MAIERIGTETVESNSTSVSQSITIPADCTFILLCMNTFHHLSYLEPNSITINGVSLTHVITEAPDTSHRYTHIYRLSNPSTGSQTFACSWTSLWNGNSYFFIYLKGVDTDSPIRDSASDIDTNPDCDITTLSGDLVIGIVGDNSGVNPHAAPGGSGQTEIIDGAQYNGLEASVGEELASGASVNFSATAATGATLCACSLIPEAGAGLQTIDDITGIASAEAFGSHKVNLWIAASAIASLEALGTPQLNFTLAASGIVSAEAFGTAKLNFTIFPSAIASLEAFGTPIVFIVGGEQFILPSGIASLEALGTAKLNFTIEPSGIATLEALGTPQLNFIVTPSGIISAEAFGTQKLNFTLKPQAIASAEALGAPKLNFILKPSGIVTAEALGTPKINLIIHASGIASVETFGVPALSWDQIIEALSIISAEAFGSPAIISGELFPVLFKYKGKRQFGYVGKAKFKYSGGKKFTKITGDN